MMKLTTEYLLTPIEIGLLIQKNIRNNCCESYVDRIICMNKRTRPLNRTSSVSPIQSSSFLNLSILNVTGILLSSPHLHFTRNFGSLLFLLPKNLQLFIQLLVLAHLIQSYHIGLFFLFIKTLVASIPFRLHEYCSSVFFCSSPISLHHTSLCIAFYILAQGFFKTFLFHLIACSSQCLLFLVPICLFGYKLFLSCLKVKLKWFQFCLSLVGSTQHKIQIVERYSHTVEKGVTQSSYSELATNSFFPR